ncbi:hypothetical protein [Pedobacter gandavensis]|uniref:hypothetical protein n=1 Tax=Pedobacter gandavensis TaxID=2679963 RepID=UPI00292EB62A|nr:hypothetical protein [Pedobacter gandavensis]
MVLVQFIKSVIDFPFHGTKEYSIAKEEWLIVFVFVVWFLSYTCLWMSLRFQIRALRAKISLALLLISSIGLIFAGILNMNPAPPFKEDYRQINKPPKPGLNEERHIRYR